MYPQIQLDAWRGRKGVAERGLPTLNAAHSQTLWTKYIEVDSIPVLGCMGVVYTGAHGLNAAHLQTSWTTYTIESSLYRDVRVVHVECGPFLQTSW